MRESLVKDAQFIALFSAVVNTYLPERERGILSLRYGLVDGAPRTLEAIARELGVSAGGERVQRLVERIERKLRYFERNTGPGSPIREFRSYLKSIAYPDGVLDLDHLAAYISSQLGGLSSQYHLPFLLHYFLKPDGPKPREIQDELNKRLAALRKDDIDT